MKEVIAIVRTEKWNQLKQKLVHSGFLSWTVQSVVGRGKQQGIRYLATPEKEQISLNYIAKRMVTMIVRDREVNPLVNCIVSHCWTGEIGDGRVFVLPCEEAVRVRTAESGSSAL